MWPKKARNPETSTEFDELDSLEGPSIAPLLETEQKMPRKRAPPRQGHAAIVLAVDVGSTSALQSVLGETESDLQRSLQIADWIISRKVND